MVELTAKTISRRSFLVGVSASLVGCSSLIAEIAQARAASPKAAKLIAAARRQVGVTLTYDPAYTRLSFPNGDVNRAKGVCTDVLVRAYRDAFGIDLQALVNADMKRNFSAYPKRWGLPRPDSNIDHRRVPNLQTFFTRAKARLRIPELVADWQPGDIFTSLIDGRLPHTGVVSDKVSALSGRPLIIHNIGAGAREEDGLASYPLTGRFRFQL